MGQFAIIRRSWYSPTITRRPGPVRGPSSPSSSEPARSDPPCARWAVPGEIRLITAINIDNLTEAELIDLNHRIVERLRFLEQTRAHTRMLTYRIGDRVTFQPEGRPPVAGVLVRYNRKTVTIITDDGQRWNVSPSLLSTAETAAPAAASNVTALTPRHR